MKETKDLSVRVNERKESKLIVLVKVLELVKYTHQILSNEHKFDPRFDYVLGDNLKNTTQQIYRDCWRANGIRVASGTEGWEHRYEARRALQKRALANCDELLILMDMAYATYHLSSKRMEFWGNLVREARMYIKKWGESERKHCLKM